MDVSKIKDEYTRRMLAKLDQWNAEIDNMTAKANQAEAQTRAEYHKQLEILYRKKDEARNKLTELENASENAWEDMKSGVETAWESMGESINSAKSRFK